MTLKLMGQSHCHLSDHNRASRARLILPSLGRWAYASDLYSISAQFRVKRQQMERHHKTAWGWSQARLLLHSDKADDLLNFQGHATLSTVHVSFMLYATMSTVSLSSMLGATMSTVPFTSIPDANVSVPSISDATLPTVSSMLDATVSTMPLSSMSDATMSTVPASSMLDATMSTVSVSSCRMPLWPLGPCRPCYSPK